jgi:thiol:disulfide interchange protein
MKCNGIRESVIRLPGFNYISSGLLLFFDADGQERREYRMVGFMDAEDFQAHVNKALR